jgi:uncharacterized protein (DUF433 family)
MAIALQHQFKVVHGAETLETYTQGEALEIARGLSLQANSEISVYDMLGKIKARVFVYEGKAYVDEYLNERIAVCEIIVHGKPRIASARIPVQIILDYLAEGATIKDLTSEHYYPDLTADDILACIAYASSIVRQSTHELDI